MYTLIPISTIVYLLLLYEPLQWNDGTAEF